MRKKFTLEQFTKAVANNTAAEIRFQEEVIEEFAALQARCDDLCELVNKLSTRVSYLEGRLANFLKEYE